MLRVPSPTVEAQLARSIEQGLALIGWASMIIDFSDDQRWKAARKEWIERTDETLDHIYEGPQEVNEFESAAFAPAAGQQWQIEYNDSSSLHKAVDVLMSLQDRLDDYVPGDLAEAAPAPMAIAAGSSLPTPATGRPRTDGTRQVFLVHGRDEKLKDAVADLLERAGPHPVTILNERPSDRRMLVEHPQERNADSRHAVILLTADDVAGPRLDSGREPHFSLRARQGVVFELGVLVAALTPRCLCVLYEEGVELPCHIEGITYVLLDLAGTWRSKLLLYLRGAGFDYDLNMLAAV
jgi:predicted nucleotide-binding protein